MIERYNKNMREIAVININDTDIKERILGRLNFEDNVTVFYDHKIINIDTLKEYCGNFVSIPEDILTSQSKIKNFVSRYYFERNYKGFLHVIEDVVNIYNDPRSFMDEIEKMMTVLDQKSWFNTITDVMNFTFKVYNPRFSVDIDEENVKKVYSKKLNWCSNANTSWVVYDYSRISFDDIAFDETFSIPMFYIIKFLSERRNKKTEGELYYMNFYPSIDDERNVFNILDIHNDRFDYGQDVMNIENEIFKKQNINYTADMSIETIMDEVYSVLMKKR